MKFNFYILINTIFLVLYFTFSTQGLVAQSIGLSSGVGKMSFIDFEDDPENFYTNYKSGEHQFIKFDLINFLPDAPFLNLSFRFERSLGEIKTAFFRELQCFNDLGSLNQCYYLNSEFTIYKIGFILNPLHINVYKNFTLNIGTELSKTLRSFEKDFSNNIKILPDGTIAPRENFDSPIRDLAFGVLIEFQFGKFTIGKKITVSPIYNATFSISEEIDTGFNTRSIRQSLGIAIQWELDHKSNFIH